MEIYESIWAYRLLNWLVSAAALLATAYLVPGFKIRNFGSALIAALVIGLANMFLRPLLLFLTLPINILTLGLFTFVVNGIIFRLAAAILKDFEVDGWFAAIFGAFIFALLQMLIHALLPF